MKTLKSSKHHSSYSSTTTTSKWTNQKTLFQNFCQPGSRFPFPPPTWTVALVRGNMMKSLWRKNMRCRKRRRKIRRRRLRRKRNRKRRKTEIVIFVCVRFASILKIVKVTFYQYLFLWFKFFYLTWFYLLLKLFE